MAGAEIATITVSSTQLFIGILVTLVILLVIIWLIRRYGKKSSKK
nr:hypothetical protein [uncultured Methanobacterium sp.]